MGVQAAVQLQLPLINAMRTYKTEFFWQHAIGTNMLCGVIVLLGQTLAALSDFQQRTPKQSGSNRRTG